jgi:hypothetical protein
MDMQMPYRFTSRKVSNPAPALRGGAAGIRASAD